MPAKKTASDSFAAAAADPDNDSLLVQRWKPDADEEGGTISSSSSGILFESEPEREERIARQLREQRRKRLHERVPATQQPTSPSIQVESANFKKSRTEEAAVVESNSASTSILNDDEPPQNKVTKEEESHVLHESAFLGDDMFSIQQDTAFTADTDVYTRRHDISTVTRTAANTNTQDMDDAEGYYKASIGEILSFTREMNNDHQVDHKTTLYFKVLGIIGKGVFSTVLKCIRIFPDTTTNTTVSAASSEPAAAPVIAIKLIRNNELMTKAAQKEAKILRLLRFSSSSTHSKQKSNSSSNKKIESSSQEQQPPMVEPSDNYNIVKMLEWQDFFPSTSTSTSSSSHHSHTPLLEYNLHTVLFFEHLSINLRELLAKFGKNVGINLAAVRSYAQQLFLALQHLQSHGIIHADIKLDNILVSHCFQHVKLCDFGSAFLEADPLEKEILTPYLVSRFYRAPEIILGLDYDPAIDVWSSAVTLGELFTGQVLFAGRTNNDMLSKFMESLGPFSHRMMKRHIMSYTTKFNRVPHFVEMSSGGTYAFRKQDVDDVTGRPVIRIVPVAEGANVAHDQSLAQILLRAKSKNDSRVDVLQLADFLHRCLALDPTKRLKVDAALKHDLFVKKKTTTNMG